MVRTTLQEYRNGIVAINPPSTHLGRRLSRDRQASRTAPCAANSERNGLRAKHSVTLRISAYNHEAQVAKIAGQVFFPIRRQKRMLRTPTVGLGKKKYKVKILLISAELRLTHMSS